MLRKKRYTITEEQKETILMRVFDGGKYIECQAKDKYFLGYVDGKIAEMSFYSFFVTVTDVENVLPAKYRAVKFGNLVMNKFFGTKGLKCSTAEYINFDKDSCAHVGVDVDNISFYFWQRHNNTK